MLNPWVLILTAALASSLAACTTAASPTPGPGGLPPETRATEKPPIPLQLTAPAAPPGPTSAEPSSPTPLPSPTPLDTRPAEATLETAGKPAASAPGLAAAWLPDAPDRDLYRLAAELKRAGEGETRRVVNPDPVTYAEGRMDTFWLVDLPDLRVYRSRFELRLVTPHAYWYVEEGLSIPREDIERSAAAFEEAVYPAVTGSFGLERSPGVDNDPHLNILNARLRGLGGYFSSTDEYPIEVFPYSNQREVIYVNTGGIPVGSSGYLEVLAHELQHAVHWNADPTEETWVNEGLSEVAAATAGYGPSSIYQFLGARPTSLVHWPILPFGAGPNYGAASLFMHYLAEHYGGGNGLRRLVQEPGDGIPGIDAFLKASGYAVTFRDVFRDWAVANILDEDRGLYGYSDLEVRASVSKTIGGFSRSSSEIPQYGVEYLELTGFQGPVRLRFQAPAETPLLPAEVDSRGCWWSNSGDSISSTLTRPLDLRGLERANLVYQVWYDLEENWDYAYLEVSTDGGLTWNILETPHTTPENPIGNSFGTGYTGDSRGWTDESVDLAAYSGQELLLRFHYVTDDAINGAGLCVRSVALEEAGPMTAEEWQADGFVLTDNRVRQEYIVQVIQVGGQNRVTVMPLDDNNSGEVTIPAPQDLDRLVVAVAALAPKTRQMAPYTLLVEPAD